VKLRSLVLALGMLLALWLLPAAARADEPHVVAPDEYAEELQGFVPGASRLEGTIRAPCCWNQTLDIHGSEVSNALRREIRKRLLAGESEQAITASLVARYGEKILAVPPGSPLKGVAILLSLTMAAAGIGGFFMLRRWKARGSATAAKKSKAEAGARAVSSEYTARLDAELKALDD
jgi:cytochrome c-type biogenesis protein CcmH